MMRLNSPSLICVSIVYIILYYFLLYSKILDKCAHPKLSKTLSLPALQISGHHVNLQLLAFNSLFQKTATKCVQEGLSRKLSQTINTSNQSNKNKNV